jgi:YHS domain-containing protein
MICLTRNMVWYLATIAPSTGFIFHHPARFHLGDPMAKDPVCGMTVSKDAAPAKESYKGHTFYFCSDACKEKFEQSPDKYATPAAMLM